MHTSIVLTIVSLYTATMASPIAGPSTTTLSTRATSYVVCPAGTKESHHTFSGDIKAAGCCSCGNLEFVSVDTLDNIAGSLFCDCGKDGFVQISDPHRQCKNGAVVW
jgi:hypothetical protein